MPLRPLTMDDLIPCRDLWLSALAESPTAFGADPEQDAAIPLPVFAARFQHNISASNRMFGAFSESGQLGGIAGFSRDHSPKRAHVGGLWGMYVAPEFRRKGLGAELLDAVISHARQLGSIRRITLMVIADNAAACALYASRGFERFGFERGSVFIDGKYLDEEHLALDLCVSAADAAPV